MFVNTHYRKSSAILTGLLATIALAQNVQAQTPATNLVRNGSAEEGSEQSIAAWQFTDGKAAPDELAYGVGSEASDGKQSFRISLLKPVQANVWWSQELAIPAGTKSLQISCDAKSKTDTERTAYAVPALSCYFLDANNGWMQWQEVSNIADTTNWTGYGRNVIVPTGATKIGVRLGVQSKGVIETSFDNVQVIPSTDYQNAVENGDLESGTGTQVRGWTFNKQAGNEQQLSYGFSPKAASGKQSLRLSALDNNTEVHGYWSQVIATTPGVANYQISLRGKIGENTGAKQADATASYAFLNEKRQAIGQMAFGLLIGNEWADYSTTVSPPADAKFIEIRLGLDGTGQTEALFDDIKLIPTR